ncbi:MAG: DUF4097 family beta strand repeat-containing protein [Gemmatimonadaceae bacterium]
MARTLLLTGILLAAATNAAAQDRRDDYLGRIDSTFAFDRRGTVVLSVGAGEIVVTAWNRDQIRVRARSERSVIRMDATSSRLSLELARARGGDSRFEVTVPIGVRVSARATSGDVSITGTKGGVEGRTQSGDLTVDDVAETIDLNTYSGDIVARTLNGNVEITTLSGEVGVSDVKGDVDVTSVSGDIDLRNVVARYVRAKTTSGDVSYDGAIDSTGRYELGSHSGSVYLTVPQNTGALLSVATYSGSIESDFPITLKPGEHGIGASKRFTFEIGKGDARISAESFSGDITIRSKGRRAGPTDR